MWDGEDATACLGLILVHVVPKFLRIDTVERGEGKNLARLSTVFFEDDDAVQVAGVFLGVDGCSFEANKGREYAGLVVFVGQLDLSIPNRANDLRAIE